MKKIHAIMEKYDGTIRITPECPTKQNKDNENEVRRVKANVIHWVATDAMDIFLCPPRNPIAATTRVVKRFPWNGSIVRSIYGCYRINLPSQDEHGNSLTIKQLNSYVSEAQKWILEDKKCFKPKTT